MTDTQIWSWIVTLIGVVGLILAGKKVWWSWYWGLGTQVLWTFYAIVSGQPAFFVSVIAYSFVYGKNAYSWTREHFAKKYLDSLSDYQDSYVESLKQGVMTGNEIRSMHFNENPYTVERPFGKNPLSAEDGESLDEYERRINALASPVKLDRDDIINIVDPEALERAASEAAIEKLRRKLMGNLDR